MNRAEGAESPLAVVLFDGRIPVVKLSEETEKHVRLRWEPLVTTLSTLNLTSSQRLVHCHTVSVPPLTFLTD